MAHDNNTEIPGTRYRNHAAIPTGADLLAEYKAMEAAQDKGEIEAGVTTAWLSRLSRTELREMLKELDDAPSVGRR